MLALILACELDSPAAGSEPCETRIWFVDADGDGVGAGEIEACEAPGGAVSVGGDCDDADPTRSPDAIEACDGVDQDCDGAIDEDFAFFAAAPDADEDTYGDPTRSVQVCALPEGWVLDSTDCADDDAAVNPGAPEICNGFDDDCDGLVDLDDSPVSGFITMYLDDDGDGYGDASASDIGCEMSSGYAADATDCDDAEASIHPDAVEVCLDVIDQDCDGYADDYECTGSETTATVDLCDPTVVPVDESLCAAGVAAVLPTGTRFATVQSAIDAAAAGDVVTVCPGTWTENLVQTVSPLSLVGYGTGLSVLSGAGATVLDAGSGLTLTLVDLAIENGFASDGGGLSGSNATICIARTFLAANYASNQGGGVNLAGTGTLQIEDSVFYANDADGGGGGILAGTYVVTVEDSSFYGNWSGYEAGALALDSTGGGSITRTEFTANEALYSAGALDYGGWGPATTLDLTDVTFTSNNAGYAGGAIDMGSRDDPTINCYACTFVGNTSTYEGGAVNLGSWEAGTFNAVSSTFTGNSSGYAGAINLAGRGSPTVNLENCTLDANTATTAGAFNLNVIGSAGWATVNVIDSTITRNVATTCGGAYVDNHYATLTSVNSDWGTGATENRPDDVCGYAALGAAASFKCSLGGCF